MSFGSFIKSAAVGVAAIAATSTVAQAGLTLTQTGINDGFVLTQFVGGYNFGNYGPLSQGVLPDGKIITGSLGDSKIYIFNDTDNQTLASAVTSVPYTQVTGNPHWAMATAGGQVYGAQLFGGPYVKFATDGSFTPMTGPVAQITNFLGMWGNPANGHIIAASNSGLVDIDPSNGGVRIVNSNLFPDGVSVSADGKKAFIENGGTIQIVDLTTGAVLQTFNNGHSPDGTGVIIGGKFDGFIVVNNNDGTLGLIDPTIGTEDIIADGGSRGDFTSVDTNNGTLFISQIEQVMRLSCGKDCTIAAPPPPPTSDVPEPATLALLGLGIAGMGIARRRRG